MDILDSVVALVQDLSGYYTIMPPLSGEQGFCAPTRAARAFVNRLPTDYLTYQFVNEHYQHGWEREEGEGGGRREEERRRRVGGVSGVEGGGQAWAESGPVSLTTARLPYSGGRNAPAHHLPHTHTAHVLHASAPHYAPRTRKSGTRTALPRANAHCCARAPRVPRLSTCLTFRARRAALRNRHMQRHACCAAASLRMNHHAAALLLRCLRSRLSASRSDLRACLLRALLPVLY